MYVKAILYLLFIEHVFILAGSGGEKGDVFDKYGQEGSPFDLVTEEAVEEDIMANGEAGGLSDDDDESDEDVPIELKRDFVDEHIGDTPRAPPPHASSRLSHSKVIKEGVLLPYTLMLFITLDYHTVFVFSLCFIFYTRCQKFIQLFLQTL